MKLEMIEAGLREERLKAELEYLAILRAQNTLTQWQAERLFEAAFGNSIRRMLTWTATSVRERNDQTLDIDAHFSAIRQAFFGLVADQEAHATERNTAPQHFWKEELSKITRRRKRRSLKRLVNGVARAHNRKLLGL